MQGQREKDCANPLLRQTGKREIEGRIALAESLDLERVSEKVADFHANECFKGCTVCTFELSDLLGDYSLFRAVRPNGRPINTREDVGSPPAKYVTDFGRANLPGQPRFYAATAQDTAVLEMRPKVGERIVVSEWRPHPNLKIHVRELGLIETCDRLAPHLASKLNERLTPSIGKGMSQSDVEKNRLIRQFLARQFTKIVDRDVDWEHKLSAAIAARQLTGVDGLVYGSVASEQSGINVVLHPASEDSKLDLIQCTEYEIAEEIATFQYKGTITRRSRGISEAGAIEW